MAQMAMTVDVDANKCCDRLKHGREVTQYIIDLVKARIELENEYATKLAKISQPEENSNRLFGIVGKKGATVTTGSLGESLQTFLQTSQQVAKIHQEMKAALIISLQALHDFSTKQEQDRKPISENTGKIYKQLQATYAKMNDSIADRKSKEEKAIEKRTERDTTPKDNNKYDKIYKLCEKAEKAFESARIQQENDEAAYNDARKQWEDHSAKTYTRSKDMEKDRIVNLRCALWRFANTQSTAAVATDEQSAALRASLRNCHPSLDVKDAIPVPEKAESANRPPSTTWTPAAEPSPIPAYRSTQGPPNPPAKPPLSLLPPVHHGHGDPPTSNGGASGDHRNNIIAPPPLSHPHFPQHRMHHQTSTEGPNMDPTYQTQARLTEELRTRQLRGNQPQPQPEQGQGRGLRRNYPEQTTMNGRPPSSPPFSDSTKL